VLTKVSLLSKHPLFESLDLADISFLAKSSIEREYSQGDILAYSGDNWPYFFIIIKGCIEALKMSMEGRNLMVGSFNSGDVFWGLAFFHENEPTPITLQAKLASKIILWSKETLQPIIMKNSKLSWEISRLMVTHMIRASAIVEGLAFQPVAGRVAAFLLENYPNEKQPQQRNLTLDEMAARTGTTSEMVCRLLQKFAVSGAIEITRTEFSIVDRQKLETISNKI